MSQQKRDIVVVGGGVLGLSTALVLAERLNKSHRITVISEFLPSDKTYAPEYTSPWAGAHFRPFPSKSESELREYKLNRLTQKHFRYLAKLRPESSVAFIEGVDYIDNPDQFYSNVTEGYSEDMNDFKLIPKEQLPKNVNFGASYETWVLNPPIYLNFLLEQLASYKVSFVQKRLNSLKEVKDIRPNSIIVNCSGMGLQYYGGYDPKSYPIRGQTLLVEPPPNADRKATVTHQLKNGEWTFYIPRPLSNGIIIGGTKQPENYSNKVSDEDTRALIQRASQWYPQYMKTNNNGKKYFDIKKINVGFRPAREGGLKLDIEQIDKTVIVNNYGAGGMGYELSYGSALEVYNLIEKNLRPKVKL
ncbi:uncharacterized protein PRCAT00000375001 [Priceomyces carsonii]|uniref:uncharacterized protein n=1 Tax=Priceomyces carsonii TaxID=28549 RepID=UPI002ED93A0E|nr:unnamed protein product [Priceomyces carsonii]